MEIHVCDSCGHEVADYTKDELTKQGWQWHPAAEEGGSSTRKFVMCDECEAHFAEARALTAAA